VCAPIAVFATEPAFVHASVVVLRAELFEIFVLPAIVKRRSVEDALAAMKLSVVPLFRIKFDAALEEAPIDETDPPSARLATRSVPAEIDVTPV
jgi:hypothetical protein